MKTLFNQACSGVVPLKLCGKHKKTEFDKSIEAYNAYCKEHGYISYGKCRLKSAVKKRQSGGKIIGKINLEQRANNEKIERSVIF